MSCYVNDTCSFTSTGTAPQLFSSAFQFLAAAQCLISTFDVPDADVCGDEEFDYIIIGAGTAGCVVANRLTEDKQKTVLLIEAGDSAPIESRIPRFTSATIHSKYDWNYLTSNDGRTNQANINGSINWPRGKIIGGSSNLNAMMYVKGADADYDAWYRAGNKEWHPKIVEYYFKKAENFQYLNLFENPNVYDEYGHNGPLVINKFNSTNKALSENIIDSLDELGLHRVVDLNLPGTWKSGTLAVTAANGERQSADHAYLYPIRHRSNLKILKNTLVTKILLDESKKAYGVEAEHNGKKLKYCAKLEVILSAGSINSPQLLMLSGIGPRDHLKEKNIDCKLNSPMVGKNLQDHAIVPVSIYGKGPGEPDEATKNVGVFQYFYNRTGYFAESSYSDVSAFFSSLPNLSYPEFQVVLHVHWKNSTSTRTQISEVFRYKEPVVDSIVELNKDNVLFFFNIVLLHPFSRGNISLNTNNPKDHPLIYPNYFYNSRDLYSTVMAIRKFTKILKTEFFKSIDAFLGRMKWPACDIYKLDSFSYWKCICINLVSTIFHPVGTCKMGPNLDTSVVDSRLRVHGVKNLRVIDASIMPTTTSGNTNGPTNMIGERGADLVKADHNSNFIV